ncbi:MAG TPA: YbaK/EbsC family protein [Baekduia sp.]|nr:YbaK/EbsC family protein [Baekduia sp.]
MEPTSASRTGAVRWLGRSPRRPAADGVRFADRRQAGRVLAGKLGPFRGEDPVVVGMARGGVPVAAEVARELDAPLDVVLVRKVGAPSQPEFAIGALAEGGVRVIADDVVSELGIGHDELEALIARQHAELDSRLERYRSGRPPLPVEGRTVLLVDDGLATGRSARAAALSLRARGAARIVLAVPVAAPTSVKALRDCVDEAVCVAMPSEMWAVGLWYDDFRPTSDAEVMELLTANHTGGGDDPVTRRAVEISAGPGVGLPGELTLPEDPRGVVAFAHGSGSSRLSPRNRAVAETLNRDGIGTLLFDLLTPAEEADRRNVFDIPLLAARLLAAIRALHEHPATRGLPLGCFGASTGAAAALVAAADARDAVAGVVSRGGRPDLAGARLPGVAAPTLLIVGGADVQVLELNRLARDQLRCPSELAVVPGATHLFEEPGALEEVARLASGWFRRCFAQAAAGARVGADAGPAVAGAAMQGAEVVTHFLEHHGTPYELLEHEETLCAGDEAYASGVAPAFMAKTVVLHDDDGFRLAVIPASERLDVARARRALGASRHLRLATEEEMEQAFLLFETGAIPPFSALVAVPEVIDRRLLTHDRIVCSSGDHRHSLIVSPRELERLGQPRVADVCRH